MDGCDVSTSTVRTTQWLQYGDGPGHVSLSGQKILIVDEVGGRGRAWVGGRVDGGVEI
jgi:hypothetical protein